MPSLTPITSQWDWLFWLYATIGITVGVVVIGWLIANALLYRSKPNSMEPQDAPAPNALPRDRGSLVAGLLLIVVVAGLLFPITLGTMETVDVIERPPERPSLRIKVVAFQWGFLFIYPNGKELLGELRLPKGEVVILEVTSQDVFHNVGFIDFKVKADAIPGKVNTLWLQVEEVGSYRIQCFELCGAGHALMKGKVSVMEPNAFWAWYEGGEG